LHKTSDKGPQVDDEYLFKVVDALELVAKEVGKTVPQVALNWLLRRPSVSTVIIGARNEEQLRQNLAAEGWSLTPSQIQTLDRASEQKSVYPYWHQNQFPERNPPPAF
jgi:aryl-alcohol dehydrogenase-like predicted oxidoreductase